MPMACFSILSPPHPTLTLTLLPPSHSQCGGFTVRVSVALTERLSQHHKTNSIIPSTRAAANGGGFETETAVVEKPQLKTLFQASRGYPSPFGATVRDGGVNFAISSLNALSATLCFFTLSDFQNVSQLLLSSFPKSGYSR